MAGNFGIIGTKYIDVSPTVDDAYLRQLQTASGLELANLFTLVNNGMTALNEELPELLAGLVSFTDEPEAEARTTGRKHVKRAGEYTIARAQRTDSVTYMLPIDKADISMGFTEDGLHEISLAQFNREVQANVDAWRRLHEGEVLSALFDPTLVPVSRRSSVLSPRLAGSGTGDYAFTGTYPDGSALPGGYTHYYRDEEADLATLINSMRARLAKWHTAPFDLIGTPSAIDLIMANTTYFTPTAEIGVTPGGNTAQAQLDPDIYVGQWKGRIRVRHGIDSLGSTNHFAIFKSYGDNDERNVLKWRYDARWGRAAFVRTRDDFPLADATIIQHFGIGVGDRAGAVVAQIAASGAYAAPTITF